MADQREPKKETVRITLPPPGAKPGAAGAKRDTVRITLPARPPAGAGPLRPVVNPQNQNRPTPPPFAKVPAPASPPAGSKPFAPPPLRPPPAPPRPASATPPPFAPTPPRPAPPKTPPPNLPPPPVIHRPPAPAVPPPTPAASGIYPGATTTTPPPPAATEVVDADARALNHPKKETARISLVPDAPPAPVAAPVNMKKTQPLLKTPLPTAQPAPVMTVANPAIIGDAIEAIPRPLLWAILAGSALTFLIQAWNYFSV